MLLNVMHHCCLDFLIKNLLYYGVTEFISFQKLVGILEKMTIANVGRQH